MNGPRIGGLFEGYGGLTMAVRTALGGELSWYSETDPGASKVLAHHHPDVPNLGDVTAVDWSRVPPVDVLAGGFPCQDVSLAGAGAGLRRGTRSGLWFVMADAIRALRPPLVVIENVRGLLSSEAHSDLEPCPWCLGDDDGVPLRALGAVLGDLADLGYDARWCGLRAADVGAPHGRYRIFIVAAHTTRVGRQRPGDPRDRRGGPAHHRDPAAHTDSTRRQGTESTSGHDVPSRRVAADATGTGREPAGSVASGSAQGAEPEAVGPVGRGGGTPAVDWAGYEPAIQRWEAVLGRPAPSPVTWSDGYRRMLRRRLERRHPKPVGMRGSLQPQHSLNARFVEWLMGLPDGHVTSVPGLSRNQQLRLLGNGVVPQQGSAALRALLDHHTDHQDIGEAA